MDDAGSQAPRGLYEILTSVASLTEAQKALLHRIATHNKPTTVSELAREADLHVSSVRESLDVLIETGLVTQVRLPSSGRGRPAHGYLTYIPADGDFPATMLSQLTAVMFDWLGRHASDPPQAGLEMGERWGDMALEMMRVPQHPSVPPAGFSLAKHMDRIRLFLTAFGFAATPDPHNPTALIINACPFTEATTPDPVALALREGMINKVLERTAGNLAYVNFHTDKDNPVRAYVELTARFTVPQDEQEDPVMERRAA